jgi:hypothetical protein
MPLLSSQNNVLLSGFHSHQQKWHVLEPEIHAQLIKRSWGTFELRCNTDPDINW